MNGKMRRLISTAMLAIALMTATGCQQVGSFFGRLSGRTPFSAARKMQDPHFADERREGINELVANDFGKRPPYTKRYQQIAQADPDYTVRAIAVRALNRARDKSATDVFVKALSDRNDLGRLEAAKALGNVPDPSAVEGLSRIVTNGVETRDLRIAAAHALRHYRHLGAARSLVNVLNVKDFGVAWQARRSLRKVTGRDLKHDEGAWLTYLTTQNPFG